MDHEQNAFENLWNQFHLSVKSTVETSRAWKQDWTQVNCILYVYFFSILIENDTLFDLRCKHSFYITYG